MKFQIKKQPEPKAEPVVELFLTEEKKDVCLWMETPNGPTRLMRFCSNGEFYRVGHLLHNLGLQLNKQDKIKEQGEAT